MLAMRSAVRRFGKAAKRFQRRTAAAVKLQAAFRGMQARRLAAALRAERHRKQQVRLDALSKAGSSSEVRMQSCTSNFQRDERLHHVCACTSPYSAAVFAVLCAHVC